MWRECRVWLLLFHNIVSLPLLPLIGAVNISNKCPSECGSALWKQKWYDYVTKLELSAIFCCPKTVTFAKSAHLWDQKNGTSGGKIKILRPFYSSNIPQIWPLQHLFHGFITFGCNLGHISILFILHRNAQHQFWFCAFFALMVLFNPPYWVQWLIQHL